MIQEVKLKSTNGHIGYPPPDPIGHLVRCVPGAVQMAVRIAFRGHSTSRGRKPKWLRAMTDIRFVDAKGGDETVVRFEIPRLGQAAGDLYRQLELWRTKPDADDTGFDLLGDIIAELDREHRDSEMLDPPILRQFSRFKTVVNGYFQEMLVTGTRYPKSAPALITQRTVATAKEFQETTPAPVRTRLVGTLDMIRGSSESFALQLDDGSEVRGQLTVGEVKPLGELLLERVLVLGTALFRPSGRLLRVDAESVTLAEDEPPIWSLLPEPSDRRLDARSLRAPRGRKRGLAAIVGQWPGDETDEEIAEFLRELS